MDFILDFYFGIYFITGNLRPLKVGSPVIDILYKAYLQTVLEKADLEVRTLGHKQSGRRLGQLLLVCKRIVRMLGIRMIYILYKEFRFSVHCCYAICCYNL